MSLAIEVDDVSAVLLNDGWHHVFGNSFLLDSYEFLHGDFVLHGGGWSGICAKGFEFTERDDAGYAGTVLVGPLSAILAVACDRAPLRK